MDKKIKLALKNTNKIDYLIAAVGMALMLCRFLNYPPVLPDEAIRYNEVSRHSYLELTHLGRLGSTVHDSCGFLAMVKLLTSALPPHEYSLRLYPFICAIVSVWLFAGIKSWFSPGFGGNVALALLAVSPWLAYYSCHLMPYSSDLLITILLLYLFKALYESDLRSRKELLRAALFGSLAVFFSLPSVFMLSGVVCTLALEAFLKRDKIRLRRLLYISTAWLASFAIYYSQAIIPFINKTCLVTQWVNHFWPRSASAAETFIWLGQHFYKMFSMPANLLPALGIPLFFWGVIVVFRKNRLQGLILVLPFIMTLLATFWQKYPFHERVLIFLLPLLFILIGCGLEDFNARVKKNRFQVISLVILCVLYLSPLGQVRARIYEKTRPGNGFEPVTAHILQNFKEGDGIYVIADGDAIFKIYQRRFAIPEQICIRGFCRGERAACVEDFSRLRRFKRIWFWMFPWPWGTAATQYVREVAQQIGREESQFRAGWSYCYLIELDADKLESFLEGNNLIGGDVSLVPEQISARPF